MAPFDDDDDDRRLHCCTRSSIHLAADCDDNRRVDVDVMRIVELRWRLGIATTATRRRRRRGWLLASTRRAWRLPKWIAAR
jgi:hypothetical protein